MVIKTKNKYPNFSESATYQLRVVGNVKVEWADRIRDLQIIKEKDANNVTVSVLTGQVEDQAALVGIIDTLCEFHLVLLSVRFLSK